MLVKLSHEYRTTPILTYACLRLNYKVLVCAPSNVAVDQLAEKISATGLKVRDFFIVASSVLASLLDNGWHPRSLFMGSACIVSLLID